MTTVQPAASAGATLRVIMASGKVPGRDGRAHADGLLDDDQAAVVVKLAGVVSPLDALGFFGKPLDEAGAVGHLALGLGEAACPARPS